MTLALGSFLRSIKQKKEYKAIAVIREGWRKQDNK
jgi:hypothetical protein